MRNGWPKFLACTVVVVIALAALISDGDFRGRQAWAANTGQSAESGVYAFSSAIGNGHELLYVFDAGSRRICIYRVDFEGKAGLEGKRTLLKLEAVRNFAADLQLSELNTEPSVAKIEGMLGQALGRE